MTLVHILQMLNMIQGYTQLKSVRFNVRSDMSHLAVRVSSSCCKLLGFCCLGLNKQIFLAKNFCLSGSVVPPHTLGWSSQATLGEVRTWMGGRPSVAELTKATTRKLELPLKGGSWVRFPLPRRNLDGKLEVRKTWMRKMVTHLENIHVARTSGPLK